MLQKRHEECVGSLIQFAGKHSRLSHAFVRAHPDQKRTTPPACSATSLVGVPQPPDTSSGGEGVAAVSITARLGSAEPRSCCRDGAGDVPSEAFTQPDVEIMFAFSFSDCYRLS